MTTARPFFMFQGGVAKAALDLYVATFPDGEAGPVGTIKTATFTLCGHAFMCADSPSSTLFRLRRRCLRSSI